MWRSLVAHFAWDEGVARSNRVIPTILKKRTLKKVLFFCFEKMTDSHVLARSPELFGWSQKRGFAPRYEFRDFVTHSTENSVRVIPTILKKRTLKKVLFFCFEKMTDSHVLARSPERGFIVRMSVIPSFLYLRAIN